MAERRKDMGKLGKHDHKLTNLLKAGIFSLVMLAPLIAIGVKCLYVVNNKNAKESYYGETINQATTETINPENLKVNQRYSFTNNGAIYIPDNFSQNRIYAQLIENSGQIQSINSPQWNVNDATIILLRRGGSGQLAVELRTDTTQTSFYMINTLTENGYFTFNYLGKQFNTSLADITTGFYKIDYNNYSYLDNVFYYSIHNLEEQETFNWVQNTAIYTPLNAMCSGLGITESAIPILLTYWALMTLIYIVFDIIIYLFTKMTHFLGTN